MTFTFIPKTYLWSAQLLSCVQLFGTPWTVWPVRFLCPQNFSGKNTGVICHFLLQGFFLTQGSNMHLLHGQADSSTLSHLGSLDMRFRKSLWTMSPAISVNIESSSHQPLQPPPKVHPEGNQDGEKQDPGPRESRCTPKKVSH